ncbi:MAG TPA: hypothetical protein VJ793_12110 [Anaerolineae bacterium]|nr:hypothetical protein [Anaerolineae bacterium]
MPFSDFANPFKNPADVPEEYRQHPRLQRLFQPDGSFTRPLEDPVSLWAIDVLHREYNVPLEGVHAKVVRQSAAPSTPQRAS